MNPLTECTEKQKLSIVGALEMISAGTDNSSKRRSQEEMIKRTLSDLGLSQSDWSVYLNNIDPSEFQKSMKSLSKMETEFYLAYVFELLFQNGSPSGRDETIAMNVCKNGCGISENIFDNTMEKFVNMGNSFN